MNGLTNNTQTLLAATVIGLVVGYIFWLIIDLLGEWIERIRS